MVSLITRVDTAHRDIIHDAQMDYYGTKLATCSSDKSIKIFEVQPSGQQMHVADLIGHDGPVWQVCWSHPMFGSLLASCSYDKKVMIWKEATANKWTKLYECPNHEASVNSVSWAPHEFGLKVAAASSDGSISILSSSGDGSWDVKKIASAHSIGANAVSWCPAQTPGSLLDANVQPSVESKRLVTGGSDNLVKIWREDNGTWMLEHKLEGHRDWVRDVAWANSIGLANSVVASCSTDRRVLIWKCSDLVNGKWTPTELPMFDDVVWHVSWSLCGSILAVSGGDNKISLWKENLQGEWSCISDSNKSGDPGSSARG